MAPSISNEKAGVVEEEITPSPTDEKNQTHVFEREDGITEKEDADLVPIIVTGADAAAHLLPLRDDGDPALTFRGIVIATALSGFQAVMTQIYNVGDQSVWPVDIFASRS